MRSLVIQARPFETRLMMALALVCLVSWHVPVRADELDDYLQRQREVHRIPAIVVGVLRAGELVDSRAVGLSQVELNVPASTRHVFEIGSISKQFTAYAILMLFEEGKVELHAPVGRYLSDLPPAWARPTVHQLLGHISGLPDLEEAFGYDVYRETPSDAEFLNRLLGLPLDFEPGRKWSYSNTNYWLLARVIEQLSGRTYAQFMEERIFAPLGMTSTRTALPSRILMGRAAGYRLVEGRLENREAIQSNTGRGLGDIATTVADMSRWEREQIAPRLIKPETARLAAEPVRLSDGSVTDYGYGWFTSPVLGLTARHHSGGTAGFVAEYLRFPERKLAVVLLANRFGAPTAPGRVARLVDPTIVGPPLLAAGGADDTRAGRVRELAAGAAKAHSDWQEEWFAAEFWRAIKPYLRDVEENYRRRGPLLSVTPVGANGIQDVSRPSYLLVFEQITCVMTFEFDARGRITSFEAEDQ